LGQVFNFKLGCFCYECNFRQKHARSHLELKARLSSHPLCLIFMVSLPTQSLIIILVANTPAYYSSV
jgi:hypothetical protein